MGDDSVREWRPATGLVVCGWIATVAAVGWCVALWVGDGDPAGRLIAGVAAVGIGLASLFGSRARPRLRADADGLTVRGLWRARHHPWPLVQGVRVLRVRRFGRESSLLEIDTLTAAGAEQLFVFGRLDLDADPEDVAPQLLARRP
jgi:Bacterial PH domain